MSVDPDISSQILAVITSAERILLHCHPGPDQDSVGGALAMAAALEALGKKVTVIKGDSEFPKNLLALPGADKILSKNFFEIDQNDYDLFLIQDSGSINQISKKGEISFKEDLRTVVIDHHTSNSGFAEINLIVAEAPATCEILFELFRMWDWPITADMARCLFAGIHADTGGFRYPETSSRTFQIAAELVRLAPDFAELLAAMENNNDKERLVFEALALNAAESFFNDRVVISTVTNEMLAANNIKREHTEASAISTKLRTVENWMITACMVEKDPGQFAVSVRGKKYDVSKIAARLGGGGHKAAAGILLGGSSSEARDRLLEAIAAEYPDLGQA